MARYVPSQGMFVNGRIADGDDMMNELNTIATSIIDTNRESESGDVLTLQTAKTYSDNSLSAYKVDGGTF